MYVLFYSLVKCNHNIIKTLIFLFISFSWQKLFSPSFQVFLQVNKELFPCFFLALMFFLLRQFLYCQNVEKTIKECLRYTFLHCLLGEQGRWQKSCSMIGKIMPSWLLDLCAVSHKKNCPHQRRFIKNHIPVMVINYFLTKPVWSKWLDIGIVKSFWVYRPWHCLGP